MSTSSSESETTPEEYRQRALLFADLGRYDDAAVELVAGLTAAPQDAALLATLGRVHIAADQPAEALVAADRAVAAGPDDVHALVVRAMALTDNQRYADAAVVAADILRRWPEDPYAQRTGAALLSEARNGQEALNSAWSAVRLAETDAESHLVLAMVAARLRLFDLAQQAYGKALELDDAVGEAQQDFGIVRLERRRWARALETLADEAALGSGTPATDPSFPRAYPAPDRPEPAPDAYDPSAGARGEVWSGPPPISRPAGPVLDPSGRSAETVRRAVLYGANGVLVAALLTALMSTASSGASRVWAGLIGAILFVAVLVWVSRHLTEPVATALGRVRSADRWLAVAAYLTFAAPLLIVVYALVGGLIPLLAAMAVAAVAEVLVISRR